MPSLAATIDTPPSDGLPTGTATWNVARSGAAPIDATMPSDTTAPSDAAAPESPLFPGDLGDLPEVAWIRLAKLLDVSIYRARSLATRACAAVTLVPRTHALTAAGALRFDRLEHAAALAQKLTPAQRSTFDSLVADLNPTKEWKRWRKNVDDIALTVQTPVAVEVHAHQERRVAYWNNGDGTACLQFTGPQAAVYAAHRRLRAWAKSLRNFHGSLDQVGEVVHEGGKHGTTTLFENAEQQFDRGKHAFPSGRTGQWDQGDAAVKRTSCGDTLVEGRTTRASSLAPMHEGSAASGGDTPPSSGRVALTEARTLDQLAFDIGLLSESQCPLTVERADGGRETVMVKLRTDSDWLRSQATVNVTVPALTLAGGSDLPGHLDDLTPIPAADVHRLIACAPSMRRLLTDPATGEVLPIAAQSYRIPQAVKTTVAARWVWCTVPGCSMRASEADNDHANPFDHRTPASGGPTTPLNLHPLCRHHHRMKTDGTLGMEMTGDGSVHWLFPAQLAGHRVNPPGSPLEVKHAQEWQNFLTPSPSRADPTDQKSDGHGTPDPYDRPPF